MDQNELDRILGMMKEDMAATVRAAVIFGVRVAESANELGVGTTPSNKVADIVAAVANGKETLIPSGAEIRQKFPDAPADIEDIRTDNQKTDQVIARLFAFKPGSQRR